MSTRGPGIHGCKVGAQRGAATAALRICVRRARLAAGLTLEQAARDVGCSEDSISRWERGETEPRFSKLLDAPVMGKFFRAELARVLEAA
jgi:DNA-binding XRE family transcriptional regulator